MRIELTEDRVRIGVRDGGKADHEVLYEDIDRVELRSDSGSDLVLHRRGGDPEVIASLYAHELAAEIGAIVDGYTALIEEVGTPADLARTVGELDARPGFVATGFVQFLLWAATRLGASELSLAPSRLGAVLRLRIDGSVYIAGAMGAERGRRAAARLKQLAGVKSHRADLRQTGSMSVVCGDMVQEFRVACALGPRGERVDVRIVDRRTDTLAPDELGIDTRALARLRRGLRAPAGLVVIAGPAGSGKTTTAYALLRELAAEHGSRSSIVAVEDTSECTLRGIGQVAGPVRDLLPTVLASDAAVVFVGDVDTREIAQVACRAAAEGELVAMTVRAGSAADALVRLVDLGVPPESLARSVRAASCQRLVRADAGRRALAEVLVADDVVREVIARRGSAAAIEATARAAGMTPLRTGGAKLHGAGIVSQAELDRVLPPPWRG